MEVLDLKNQEIKVKDNVAIIRKDILDGKIDAAKAGVVLKKLAKLTKELLEDKDVKEVIYNESIKYVGETLLGGKISESTTNTWYDFSVCKHPELDQLYDIQKNVKLRIKEIEDELKLTIPKNQKIKGEGFGIQNTKKPTIVEYYYTLEQKVSGEVIQCEPPLKLQSMGIVVRGI